MKILGNRVLARIHQIEKIGSIFLPPTAKDYYNTGGPKEFVVEEVGTGHVTRKGVQIPIDWCEPGDRILCHSYTTGPVESGIRDDLFFITPDQILAIIPMQKTTQT